ncbi:MAG: 16S rRNA (guanine(966)-N(2))-methyltransferase RsmD [Actinomycetota bacterium]
MSIRIIAGTHRGRRLETPAGDHTRPTKGIVREAVFSALDARGRLVGAAVLDCYAGSGALAFEALSRGAARAVLVERDRPVRAVIARNAAMLGEERRVRVTGGDATQVVSGSPPPGSPFDLVFADPPYDLPDEAVHAFLTALLRPGLLDPDALVCLERPARRAVSPPPGWASDWERTFGDTLVAFLSISRGEA